MRSRRWPTPEGFTLQTTVDREGLSIIVKIPCNNNRHRKRQTDRFNRKKTLIFPFGSEANVSNLRKLVKSNIMMIPVKALGFPPFSACDAVLPGWKKGPIERVLSRLFVPFMPGIPLQNQRKGFPSRKNPTRNLPGWQDVGRPLRDRQSC